MAHSPCIRRKKVTMAKSITTTTTTINTMMVTILTDKTLRWVYLGAYDKCEDELKRQSIRRRHSGHAEACCCALALGNNK